MTGRAPLMNIRKRHLHLVRTWSPFSFLTAETILNSDIGDTFMAGNEGLSFTLEKERGGDKSLRMTLLAEAVCSDKLFLRLFRFDACGGIFPQLLVRCR